MLVWKADDKILASYARNCGVFSERSAILAEVMATHNLLRLIHPEADNEKLHALFRVYTVHSCLSLPVRR